MKLFLFISIILFTVTGKAQDPDAIAMIIGTDTVTAYEYQYFRDKFIKGSGTNAKEFNRYFIDMHLKTSEAKRLGLNQDSQYLSAVDTYYQQFVDAYKYDPEPGQECLLEAYYRSFEIRDISVFEDFRRWVPSSEDYLESENVLKKVQSRIKNLNYMETGELDSVSGHYFKFRGEIGLNKTLYRFEEAAFNTTEGKMSDIYRSEYYTYFVIVHEVRRVSDLIDDYDSLRVRKFEEVRESLKEMIMSNEKRDNHLRFKYLESIKSLMGFERDAESFVRFYETYGPEGFRAGKWVARLRSDASQDTLFHISEKIFTHADFFKSLENRQYAYNLKNYKAYLSKYYLEWEEKVLTEYYLDHLTVFYPEVDMKMREFIYSELIFNVLEKEVWPKADDTNAMYDYFLNNRKKYGVGRRDKDLQSRFKESRTRVRNDFIEHIEKKWTDSLRSNYQVYINEAIVE